MRRFSQQDRVFKLLSGTEFNAGLDADKQPIIFETTQDQLLNPAQIKTAYTLIVKKALDLEFSPFDFGNISSATPNATPSENPLSPIKKFKFLVLINKTT